MILTRPVVGMVVGWLAGGGAAADEKLWLDYEKRIEPILADHCYTCHGHGEDKGSIALDAFGSLDDVLADDWTWELVLEQVEGFAMPPEDEPQPSVEQRREVAAWIRDVFFPIDCDHPDPGHVPWRRLNRTEYANTIRDLLGVDARIATDFPPDDTGYGFDNIARVLSLSPMLMEKYLAAAELALDQALVTEVPVPDRVRYDGGQLSGGQLRDGQRVLASEGEVTARHRLADGGRIRIRVLAGAEQAGDEPARMRITIDGRSLATVDVHASPGRPAGHDVECDAAAGSRRVGAAFMNDFYDPGFPNPSRRDRNLYVESIEITGPLDPPRPPLPESHRRIFLCDPDHTHSPEGCARDVVSAFTRRAYRRPPREREVNGLVSLALTAMEDGRTFEQGVRVALQAVLISPGFLFRSVEPPQGVEDGRVYSLSEHALASRLSYFLWSSMPDEELLSLADQGRLRENLPAQVTRMLRDAKGDALAANFAGQWLQIRNLAMVDPAPDWFPDFDEDLRRAMGRESEGFFAHIQREDRSILEFLDADYTFVNERLARHYGLTGVEGPAFRRVQLSDRKRGGLLGQAAFLTVTSNPNRTSPVKRGKWVLENLLGAAPPPPPDNVPALPEPVRGHEARSQREVLAEHRENPVCASCHALMDPIGFALEHYDGLGAWRDADGNLPIDDTGTLVTGESFEGMEELRALLLASKREAFVRSLAGRMLIYALGRGPIPADRCALDRIVDAVREGDYRFSVLIQEVVASVPFQKAREGERRGSDWTYAP